LYKVFSRISKKIFYMKSHQAIWQAIKILYEDNKVIDIVTISNIIEVEKLYPQSLKEIINEIADISLMPTLESLQHHISVLIEMYMVREKEYFAKRILQKAQSKTKYSELVSIANEHNVMFIDDRDAREFKPRDLEQIINTLNKESEDSIESGKARNRGLSTGFTTIDTMFTLRPQNVYCVAARPAMGKTSLTLKIALNVARGGFRVMFFSLEMSQDELLEKIISILYGMSNDDLRAMSEPELIAIRNKTSKYLAENLKNFIIDDYASDIQEIKSAAYDIHREEQLDLIVIDYLQLVESSSNEDNRNQEITKISRIIKTQISKKLQIPVIVVSQLNRSLESRKDRRPKLQDLRESGSIEQDMTSVLFLYRDEYYGIDVDRKGRSTKNIAEAIVEKNRFGKAPFRKRIEFDAESANFRDIYNPIGR
jgi:replicative DNA helicase